MRAHSVGRPGVKHGRGVNTDTVCLPLGCLRSPLFVFKGPAWRVPPGGKQVVISGEVMNEKAV